LPSPPGPFAYEGRPGRVVRGPTEFVVTVERLELNVDIPEERFALPAELRKLQKPR
jgi:hypothetical protein